MTAPETHRSIAPSRLDRTLRVFTQVRAGEGAPALLLIASVFLILCAYYVLKTVREGLILTGGMAGLRGDELKVYAAGLMALLLLAVIPAYGALADRVGRLRLLNVSYAVVLGCLGGFYALGQAGAPIGLAFFVWLGIVSVFLVAQFWSYANDVFDAEQGKRLFAVVAIGGAAGAIAGPRIAGLAGTYPLLVVAGGLLAAALALLNVVDRLQAGRRPALPAPAEPIGGPGGFALVLRDRYLLCIAGAALVANLVNTTGEFVLSSYAADLARDVEGEAERREVIKAFYADFFFWVNLASFLVQSFLVSRIIGRIGIRGALYVLPALALGAYALVAMVGGLGLVRVAKTAENATDYSLQNTVRQSLFLPTARAVKYKAKAAVDTFFVRFGDMLSAILVGVALHSFGASGRQLALVNVGLIAVWLLLVAGIARRHAALDPAAPALALPATSPAPVISVAAGARS